MSRLTVLFVNDKFKRKKGESFQLQEKDLRYK